MAEKPIKTPLPADLPENWNAGQIVAPDGTSVGLSEQHGYNYLMAAVNHAQRGVNEINTAFETVSGKRTCRVTVGTSTAGWTEADCDYLCDGTDDQVEINLAAARGSQEVVLLDGTYQITGQINIKRESILCGNGPNTVLYRASESMSSSSDTKDATIVLGRTSELHNLTIGSKVDAPNAACIYCDSASAISDIIFSIDWDTGSYWSHHTVGTGIYVRSVRNKLHIRNCMFGNVSVAIYAEFLRNTVISGCITENLIFDGGPVFVPCFVQCEDAVNTTIANNICELSSIQIGIHKHNVVISTNVVSQIMINSPELVDLNYGGGNLIAGNVLEVLPRISSVQPGITLGENTTGWFVTGNQVQNLKNEGSFFPIVDNGVNNIIRFNSDDPGGSTPATVQQATPSITVNADGTVTARATQAAGYVASGTRSATHKLSAADDTDLTPENIKDGVSIFGVEGTLQTSAGEAGVRSFNGRTGAVVPEANDYSAEDVGAIAASSAKDIQVMTQAEYDALASKNPTTLYLLKE